MPRPKLETIQMTFNRWMATQMGVSALERTLEYSDKK